MPGIGMFLRFRGHEKLMSALRSKGTIKGPLDNGIKRITLKYEGEVKKATVVDTGRLRSSITHDLSGGGGKVGTNVEYASFIEYGTEKMEARHMEGGAKALGKGMFAYAMEVLKGWLGADKHKIHTEIEGKFE